MKLISAPVNAKAMSRLDLNSCSDKDLIDLELSSEEFDALWNSGVFASLNEAHGIIIDDYEDEKISINQLESARKIVKIKLALFPDVIALKKLLDQMNLAIKNKTSIFFFF